MERILSQEEIDALVGGVKNGTVDAIPKPVVASGAVPFDFGDQERISLSRMPTLDMVNAHFIKLFRNTLSLAVRRNIEVISKGVNMGKLGQFMSALPVPSSLHLFRMDPLNGDACMVIDSKLVYTLLDLFFGGSGKVAYKIEGREFTPVESRFIKRLVDMIFTDMEKAWRDVHPVKFHYLKTEINPQFVHIAPPSHPIILDTFDIQIEDFIGASSLCIPHSLVEPIKAKLYSGHFKSEADSRWRECLTKALKDAEVEIAVELGSRKMTFRELTELKKGNVLLLDKDAFEPLVAKVGGVPKFTGRAGLYGPNKAMEIDKIL